jgi:hypothetical protein
MPTSSSPKRPLRPTYVNEHRRIKEHTDRLRRAAQLWPGQPICPDHYAPCKGDCDG